MHYFADAIVPRILSARRSRLSLTKLGGTVSQFRSYNATMHSNA